MDMLASRMVCQRGGLIYEILEVKISLKMPTMKILIVTKEMEPFED